MADIYWFIEVEEPGRGEPWYVPARFGISYPWSVASFTQAQLFFTRAQAEEYYFNSVKDIRPGWKCRVEMIDFDSPMPMSSIYDQPLSTDAGVWVIRASLPAEKCVRYVASRFASNAPWFWHIKKGAKTFPTKHLATKFLNEVVKPARPDAVCWVEAFDPPNASYQDHPRRRYFVSPSGTLMVLDQDPVLLRDVPNMPTMSVDELKKIANALNELEGG